MFFLWTRLGPRLQNGIGFLAPRGHWCGGMAPLFLHARRYSGDVGGGLAFDFVAPLPEWASSGEGEAEGEGLRLPSA